MVRPVRHLSLHRIDSTELRVVSDVETGVLPFVEAEEAVIRGYVATGSWPHEWVTLLILEDLEPLVRQLQDVSDLPPGGVAALRHRPVANAYDLAQSTSCHIFINCEAMATEGYGGDAAAVRGLLAHEHAHPLTAEGTAQASRQLRLIWSVGGADASGGGQPAGLHRENLQSLTRVLAEKLCLYAARELLANELTIQRGFRQDLFHLDQRNVANACKGVAGRDKLQQALSRRAARGAIPSDDVPLLLFIGDLKGYLDLALEVAPFYAVGHPAQARVLEAELEGNVFPRLEPEVLPLYRKLRDQYVALRPDLTIGQLRHWSGEVAGLLADALAEKGLTVHHSLQTIEP